ncbi:hypothetical protein BGW38_005465 [Lunasporangiospora selenospora]|uniref:Glycosyltransferase family 71 protein n=1 Tax=Lunasporangiospora selenospora TaxID=979761 RepID=A0A9P6FNQ8_9FUNG|nr:hypothetical protein BGW38_005465 [Lunasporangiospora selenospora]
MHLRSFFPPATRRTQTLRILAILIIFFFVASISRYQGSFEFSIDEDGQVQSIPLNKHDIYYTHHIATYDPKDIHPWTHGDTQTLKTPAGQNVLKLLTETPFQNPSDANGHHEKVLKEDHFLTLTKQMRVYRGLWKYLKEYYDELEADGRPTEFYQAPPTALAPAIDLFQRIEQHTFPWILSRYKNSFDLYRQTKNGGMGIVMCVGNYHVKFARTAIRSLREVVRSPLPIEIYYLGDNDLSKENRDWFEKIENVKTIDLFSTIDNSFLKIEIWAAKPYAILMSRFSEVILMDSDVFFMDDPGLLFNDGGYKEVGTMYFYDRTLFPGAGGDKKDWMHTFLPTMSNHPGKTQWFNSKGDHEMESGVVVFDKRRNFLGLLAICKLNDYYERTQVTYKRTWGDKETFWIAMEMIQERYSFVRYRGGVIGNVGDAIPFKQVLPKDEIDRYNRGEALTVTHPKDPNSGVTTRREKPNMDRVCGNQLHFDDRGKPLWWNSGIVRNKFVSNSPYLKYTAYMKDEDGSWDFETTCLIQKSPGAIMEVEWDQRKTAFEVLKVDREIALAANQPDVFNILDIPELIKSEGAKGGKGNNEAV